MNEEKLKRLFEAYSDCIRTSPHDYALWDVTECIDAGFCKLFLATAKEEKKDIFLKEICGAAASALPDLDWSLLPVLGKLEPRMICDEVLFFINNPTQSDTYTLSYLQGLIHRIGKRAAEQFIPMPPEDIAAQNLMLLRFLRRTDQRLPYFAHAYEAVSAHLEYCPKRLSFDFQNVLQFQTMLEEMRQLLFRQFGERINKMSLDRVRDAATFKYRDRGGHQFIAHLLLTVIFKDLLGIMSSAFQPPKRCGEKTLQQLYLENAEETIALLEPEVIYIRREYAFLESCFAPGVLVTHKRYGDGTVLERQPKTVSILFSSGETKRLKLVQELFNERLSIDSPEFRKRLFFARENIGYAEIREKTLSEAKARRDELSSGVVPMERLAEMKLFQPGS